MGIIWGALLIGIIGVGAVVSLTRYYLGQLDQHSDTVLQQISERTHVSIRAGRMRGRWQNLGLELRANNLEISAQAGQPAAISADRLKVVLDIPATIIHQTPILDRKSVV